MRDQLPIHLPVGDITIMKFESEIGFDHLGLDRSKDTSKSLAQNLLIIKEIEFID
jgi:hypothetical protein